MQLKAIIFDMDGTIVDSGLNFDLMRSDIGIPRNEPILEYLESKKEDKKYIDQALKIVGDHEALGAASSTIIRDFRDFHSFLKSNKIPNGLLTRNSKFVMDETLKMHDLEFEYFFSRDCCAPKPDPEGLNIMSKSWDIKPEQIAYIGDYNFDLETAKNAGMKAGLILNESNQHLKKDADFSFTHYMDLISYFN